MSGMNSLLDELYNKTRVETSLEKTAEQRLLKELESAGQVSDNPYENLTTAELAELALSLEKKASAGEEAEVPQATLEKIAMDALGGQVMAHAMLHEFGLIKEAMVQGLCRVCKESPRDIQGQSVCSGCQQPAA